MASIIQINTESRGNYLPLGKRTDIIGRSETVSMQVLDEQVSRKHLKIRFDESTGRHLASDMNSHNGVFVNDCKIEDEVELKEGDVIRIGSAELFYMEKDFDDAQSALHHYKKVGERVKPTMMK